MLAISAIYIGIIFVFRNRKDAQNYLPLLLLLYFQGTLLYYIWNPANNHFFSITSPLILSATICLAFFINKSRQKVFLWTGINILLILFAFIPSYNKMYKDIKNFKLIEKSHDVYNWDLDMAKIRTTMHPESFKSDIKLITKYSGDINFIYIISKYDNILPFLANKYSAMPFIEVGTSLITDKEIDDCVDVILKDSPDFIYVDRSFKDSLLFKARDNFGLDAVANCGVSREICLKLETIGLLEKIFLKVKNRYCYLEAANNIAVYKKI